LPNRSTNPIGTDQRIEATVQLSLECVEVGDSVERSVDGVGVRDGLEYASRPVDLGLIEEEVLAANRGEFHSSGRSCLCPVHIVSMTTYLYNFPLHLHRLSLKLTPV
jgi:hypothetical protein